MDRTAETREKLIRAAISRLHTDGYSLTTLGTVAQSAGVSRGALTHHFPSKVDLMLAVVDKVADENIAEYGRLLAPLPPQLAVRFIPEALWAITQRPDTMAVIEIMIATRSDPSLAAQLAVKQAELERLAKDLLVERFRTAGMPVPTESDAIFTLFVAAARGLAIERLSTGRLETTQAAVALLGKLFGLLVDKAANQD